MLKPNPPCTPDCDKRQVGCRNECQDWQKFERDRAEYRGERNAQYQEHRIINEYKRNKITKRVRKELNDRRK